MYTDSCRFQVPWSLAPRIAAAAAAAAQTTYLLETLLSSTSTLMIFTTRTSRGRCDLFCLFAEKELNLQRTNSWPVVAVHTLNYRVCCEEKPGALCKGNWPIGSRGDRGGLPWEEGVTVTALQRQSSRDHMDTEVTLHVLPMTSVHLAYFLEYR